MIENLQNKNILYLEKNIEINVKYLAKNTNIPIKKIIDFSKKLDIYLNKYDLINKDLLSLISENFKFKIIYKNNFINLINKSKKGFNKIIRSPIVTIMGHVDHGKTSLLNYINKNNIFINEIGGITQKINAYNIDTKYGNITFIDTPGHEVFINILKKGIKFTDIVLLLIAADDGIKPQTIEVIKIVLNLKLPIIVVINKIDINNNIIFIEKDLNKYKIISKKWGGNIAFIKISVKKGIGINYLLKNIIYESKKLNLLTMNDGMAKGIILDSYIDKNKGPIINSIVMEGCLKKGDIIISGQQYGKIKKIYNNNYIELYEAYPSIPIKILALSSLININEKFLVVNNKKIAKEIIKIIIKYNPYSILENNKKIVRKDLFNNISNKILINIILKTDTVGSKEAIFNLLNNLKLDKIIILKIIKSEIGIISKHDVFLALNTNAYIIGFNVDIDINVKALLKNKKIKIYLYSLIYDLIKDIKKIVNKLLNKFNKNKLFIGEAIIKNIINNKKYSIIGCKVTDGYISKNEIINIYHNNKLIFITKIKSLKHYKKIVDKVYAGSECGIIFDINNNNITNIKINDIIKTIKQ